MKKNKLSPQDKTENMNERERKKKEKKDRSKQKKKQIYQKKINET